EAFDAEFDIAAERGEAHAIFDQIPDRALISARQHHPCMAVAALDRAHLMRRLVARLADAIEIQYGDLRQVGDVAHLIIESVTDAIEHAWLAAHAGIGGVDAD